MYIRTPGKSPSAYPMTNAQVTVSVVVSTVGWAVATCAVIYGAIIFYLDATVPLSAWVMFASILGLIGFGVTAVEVWRRVKSLHWEYLLVILGVWIVVCAALLVLVDSNVSSIWDDIGIGMTIAGSMSGLVMGLVIRQALPTFSWIQVILVTLGWGLGLGLQWSIGQIIAPLAYSGYWLCYGPATMGIFSGLVGGGMTFWQIQRTRRYVAEEQDVLGELVNPAAAPSQRLQIIEEGSTARKLKSKSTSLVEEQSYWGYLIVGVITALAAAGVVAVLLVPTREVQVPVVVTATPSNPVPAAAPFSEMVGRSTYNLLTISDVGAIPANTPVRIAEVRWDGANWQYMILPQSENTFAEAFSWQLTYLPMTPVPTPPQ